MPNTIGVSGDKTRLIKLTPAELRFDLPTTTLAALEWGEPGALPVLAWHGWLDNAGSFAPLASSLSGIQLVAVDAAGHGLSGHRAADSSYNIWQDLSDILELADQLGWERFGLIGHSRGATVTSLFAGTFPDRVSHLALIEGGVPILGEPDDAPENLGRVLQRTRELRNREGRIYASRERAVATRMDGFTPVTEEAAEILARRSLREVRGGWQWHADQRLKAGSEFKLTRQQAVAFLKRIAAPTICYLAEESPFADLGIYRELLPLIANIEQHRLPGRHHLHMEDAAATIGRSLSQFFAAD